MAVSSQQTAFGRGRLFKLRLQFFPEHLYPEEAGITFADVAQVFKASFMLKLQVCPLPLTCAAVKQCLLLLLLLLLFFFTEAFVVFILPFLLLLMLLLLHSGVDCSLDLKQELDKVQVRSQRLGIKLVTVSMCLKL